MLVAWLYLATTPYHRGLNNPNEMVRVYMSVAAVEHGTFAIDPVLRRWGMVDDKAKRDGRLYSSKAPLQSLLGVPAYQLAKPILQAFGLPLDARHVTFALRLLASVPVGLLLAFVLLAWCRARAETLGADPAMGTALGLVLALGTMHYPYALTFTGHILASATAGGCYLAVAALFWSNQDPAKTHGERGIKAQSLEARSSSLANSLPPTASPLRRSSVDGARSGTGGSPDAAAESARRGFFFTPRRKGLAIVAGFLGGAAPFAEYPSALVALPALVTGLILIPGMRARAELLGWLAIGGLPPFFLGLWSHQALWGSPFRTGYAFLENTSYAQVHDQGFFGVAHPTAEAFVGTLFSPGTGLFFFSPVLVIGLVPLTRRALLGRRGGWLAPPEAGFGRGLALAALIGLALELLFMSAHRGWRGGWTLGPRYIIPVVVLLGFWCAEALGHRRLRPWLMALGAASILLTGPAAAIYPHLSDVYSNPLASFVVPTYLRGGSSYGIAHALGLGGNEANLFHLLPLLFAVLFVGFAGTGLNLGRPNGPERDALGHRAGAAGVVLAAATAMVFMVGEDHPAQARRENRRLWGFWEPAIAAPDREQVDAGPRPGLLSTARSLWKEIEVKRKHPDGQARTCRLEGNRCSYGDHPWQRFGPESLPMDGRWHPVLFMHPVGGEVVEARVPIPAGAEAAVLRYGLTDASLDSENDHLVEIVARQGEAILAVVHAGLDYGFQRIELPLASTEDPIILSMTVAVDGARVLGWNIEFYRRP